MKATSERTALFDSAPGEAGGWIVARANESIMADFLSMDGDAIQAVSVRARAAGVDSLVRLCSEAGVDKLSALSSWTGP